MGCVGGGKSAGRDSMLMGLLSIHLTVEGRRLEFIRIVFESRREERRERGREEGREFTGNLKFNFKKLNKPEFKLKFLALWQCGNNPGPLPEWQPLLASKEKGLFSHHPSLS